MSKQRKYQIPAQKRNADGKPLCRYCEGLVTPPRRTFCSGDCADEAMMRSNPGHLRLMTRLRDKGICRECGLDTEAMKKRYGELCAIAKQGIGAYVKLCQQATRRWGIKIDRYHPLAGSVTSAMLRDNLEHLKRDREKKIESPRFPWASSQYFDRRIENAESQIERIEQYPNHARIQAVHQRLMKLAEARRCRIQAEWNQAGWRSVSNSKASNLWQADHIRPVSEGGGLCGLENIRTLCTPCHLVATKDLHRRMALRRRGLDPEAPNPQMEFL